MTDCIPEGFYPSPIQPRIHEPIQWASKPEPFHFDREDVSFSYVVDVERIVDDMLDRIRDAEEGVREKVMVQWLRAHNTFVVTPQDMRDDPMATLEALQAQIQLLRMEHRFPRKDDHEAHQ